MDSDKDDGDEMDEGVSDVCGIEVVGDARCTVSGDALTVEMSACLGVEDGRTAGPPAIEEVLATCSDSCKLTYFSRLFRAR